MTCSSLQKSLRWNGSSCKKVSLSSSTNLWFKKLPVCCQFLRFWHLNSLKHWVSLVSPCRQRVTGLFLGGGHLVEGFGEVLDDAWQQSSHTTGGKNTTIKVRNHREDAAFFRTTVKWRGPITISCRKLVFCEASKSVHAASVPLFKDKVQWQNTPSTACPALLFSSLVENSKFRWNKQRADAIIPFQLSFLINFPLFFTFKVRPTQQKQS